MSFGQSSREGVTQAHLGRMGTCVPWHVACHGAWYWGVSSDVLGAAAGGAHRMLFRIPLRMPLRMPWGLLWPILWPILWRMPLRMQMRML